jgi:2-C-methyl-D-erythritol 4-phosphate cytidylyltransferase
VATKITATAQTYGLTDCQPLVVNLTSMTELSFAAQAVLDAAYKRMDENPHNEVVATLAAALRAAADQVVPREVVRPLLRDHELERLCQRQHSRSQLLAIAAELETTYLRFEMPKQEASA